MQRLLSQPRIINFSLKPPQVTEILVEKTAKNLIKKIYFDVSTQP